MNESRKTKKTIGIMSGKGGVGKSSISALIAISLSRAGFSVGILDADMGGASIPKLFGINNKRCVFDDKKIEPVMTSSKIQIISMNLLIDKEESPVIWRGPLIGRMIKEFYVKGSWNVLDYLIIDLPPGTSDASLTVMQSISLNGVIVVATPQELVQLIVLKSINMAKQMKVPILGLVENMSYYECPKCKEKIYPFGKSDIAGVVKEIDVELLAQLPIDSVFADLCDKGKIELYRERNDRLIDIAIERIIDKI